MYASTQPLPHEQDAGQGQFLAAFFVWLFLIQLFIRN